MKNLNTLHLRLSKRGKSFYHLRFLFLLWAIFLSVFFSYLTPPLSSEGYTPVYAETSVKGVRIQNSEVRFGDSDVFSGEEIIGVKVLPTMTPTPTLKGEDNVGQQYGKSRQIGEYTWTIDVPDDERTGSADEIFQALNAYRQKKGKGALQWSSALATFAASRADSFAETQKTDSHAGFMDYINNQDGFTKLGFMKLGENSSYGYKVLGVTLIEEVYAGDSPHDTNQLSTDWTHVGIGVNGVATNLIFAGKPL